MKPGKEEGQAVGYIEDGSMVVVNGGASPTSGTACRPRSCSVLPTAGGKMIFARLVGTGGAGLTDRGGACCPQRAFRSHGVTPESALGGATRSTFGLAKNWCLLAHGVFPIPHPPFGGR